MPSYVDHVSDLFEDERNFEELKTIEKISSFILCVITILVVNTIINIL